MSIFNRFIANISWNILGKTGVMIVSLGLSILIARYLGKERFGIYASLLVIPAIMRLLNSLGLETVVNKKVPELNVLDPSLKQSRYLLKLTFSTHSGSCFFDESQLKKKKNIIKNKNRLICMILKLIK